MVVVLVAATDSKILKCINESISKIVTKNLNYYKVDYTIVFPQQYNCTQLYDH